MNDHEPSPANWNDYHAAVTRFTTAIDAVLERGHLAKVRYEELQHRQETRFESVVGALPSSESLPPSQRHIVRRVLQLTENLYHTFLGPLPRPQSPAGPTAASRALRSRNRI